MQKTGNSTDEPPDLLRSRFQLIFRAHNDARARKYFQLIKKVFGGNGNIKDGVEKVVEKTEERVILSLDDERLPVGE